jgi:xanthine dehydrogenase YagS FAD-binding subunit
LTEAARGVASPQIRNMGTVAGDLCQRPRCWYFRQGFGLLGMKDGKSLVTDGENKYHAILGNGGPAYFVNASSLGPALVALGAKVKVASSSGHREISAAKFFVSPQNEHAREIALLPNEIVTEILVPHDGAKNATYEVRQKEALDWPLASASVALKMKGSTVSSARIVLGHVAPTPWAATQAEQALAGKAVTPESADEAAKAAVADAKPLSQNAYKVQLARVAVKRALLEAVRGRA